MTDIVDPIDGLIRYVQEIKPYRSKIIEVLTEYVYNESVNVNIRENLDIGVGIVVSGVDVLTNQDISIGGTFDTGPYDASPSWPVISVNITLPDGAFDATAPGYDSENNTVVIPDDQTPIYRTGRNVVVKLSKINLNTGVINEVSSNVYTITNSIFERGSKQTNGIVNNPLTRLVLSGLDDEKNYSLGSNERWVASVSLTPTDIDSIITGYSSTAKIVYTSLDPSPTPKPNNEQIADEDIKNGVYANSLVFNKDVTSSYPFSASIRLILNSGKSLELTTVTSLYNADVNKTIVRVLETIPEDEDYTGAQVVESFNGFSSEYAKPQELIESKEGLTQTRISESLSIGWFDSSGEVLDGHQYQIIEIKNSNTIVVVGDASEYISQGDSINIIESTDTQNNGQYIVSTINASGQGTEIVVSSTLTNSAAGNSEHRGWIETT